MEEKEKEEKEEGGTEKRRRRGRRKRKMSRRRRRKVSFLRCLFKFPHSPLSFWSSIKRPIYILYTETIPFCDRSLVSLHFPVLSFNETSGSLTFTFVLIRVVKLLSNTSSNLEI